MRCNVTTSQQENAELYLHKDYNETVQYAQCEKGDTFQQLT